MYYGKGIMNIQIENSIKAVSYTHLSGRTQYSASLRTAKDQCPAYIDNGINGCFNPVPYTGNPAVSYTHLIS